MRNGTPIIGIPLTPSREPDEPPGAAQVGRRKYAVAVLSAGGLPVFLPVLPGADAGPYLTAIDGLLLPGGGDVDPALFGEAPHPEIGRVIRELDDFEIALARGAVEAGIPVLGICRGEQVLNVALGGTLIQHIPAEVPGAVPHTGGPMAEPSHAIDVPAGTLLARILGAGRHEVNSTHHQSVRRVAPGLRCSAACPDDGIIEAIESPDARFVLGVQFHPEEMPARYAPLFRAFVAVSEN